MIPDGAKDDARLATRARIEAGLFAAGTIAAAATAGPVPWTACLLALAMVAVALALGGTWAPLALAIGAAPWWLEALDTPAGPALAPILAAGAWLGSGSWRLSAALAGAALFEGLRLQVLEDRALVSSASSAYVVVGGLAVAALVRGSGRASIASYAAVVGAAVLGAVPVAQALGRAPAGAADVVREARLGTLGPDESTLRSHPALGLQALALRPTWHELATALAADVGLERTLGAGWLAEGAALDPATRIAAARWLERHGRGGEGERMLARDAAPDVRWWLALFRRARGWETEAAKTAFAPRGVARFPGWLELEARNPVEVVFEADRPLGELAIERRERPVALVAESDDASELFSHTTAPVRLARTGAPLVVLQVDGVEHAAELVERGTVHLPMDLAAGPHRVWIWSEVPAIVGRVGAFD